MVRPLIGITTYAQTTRLGRREAFVAALPMSYVRAVHASGGRAVLIPPDDPDVDVLDRLDGLIIAGGSDVDPALYGQSPHPLTKVKPDRDRSELLLLRGAIERDIPLLGICRGMQLMAVAYGGSLHQHLPDLLGHDRHRPDPVDGGAAPRRPDRPEVDPGQQAWHGVTLVPGSRCHKILGDELVVNTFHHQGIADPGGLVVSGWCPDDDLIEAVEDPSLRLAIGVQWHPEATDDLRLFATLVEAASAQR